MNLLVIIDNQKEDPQLGGVIDQMMKQDGWGTEKHFPFTYSKQLSGQKPETEIVKYIKAHVDAATVEGEWKNVKYVYFIEGQLPKFAVSPGD